MRNIGFRLTLVTLLVLAVASIAGLAVRAEDDDESNVFAARLSTFREVGPKATGGTGTFRAELNDAGDTLTWDLSWDGLTGPPAAAHIHFAMAGVNGPVVTFFCGGPNGNPDVPAKPACPQTTSGSISGTTTADDILKLDTPGPNDVGIALHGFEALLNAIRAGDAYANMHTARFPGGEIRGQIHARPHHQREREHQDK